MARPRTPIGTFGDISFINATGGQFRARTRFRDDDGKVRRVSATGVTKREAERNLKKVLAERSSFRSSGEPTPNHDLETLLPRVVARHGLDDADDIAAVLCYRVDKHTATPPRGCRLRPRLIVGACTPSRSGRARSPRSAATSPNAPSTRPPTARGCGWGSAAPAWLRRRRAQHAGIDGFHLQRLRHTAAHGWLAAGGSESGLMAMAGWSRTDMMVRYTRATAYCDAGSRRPARCVPASGSYRCGVH